MEFSELITDAITNTTDSLRPFAPELTLSITIFAMLIVRLFGSLGKLIVAVLTLALPAITLFYVWPVLGAWLQAVPWAAKIPYLQHILMALLALLVAGIVVGMLRSLGLGKKDSAKPTDVTVIAFAGCLIGLFLLAPWQHLGPAAADIAETATAETEAAGDVAVDAAASPIAAFLTTERLEQPQELFSGMIVHDSFSIYVRAILLIFSLLFIVFTRLSGIPDRDDAPDFYCLVLGSVIGMCLMASANHLLVVFLAVEMASVPSYVLAAMLKGRREASEAALKYSIYGAGAAGLLLYGISLVAGVLGSAHLPTLATLLSERMPELMAEQRLVLMVLALGSLMIMAGLAFKLSAVPFHFWCPDVFEGASAEVNAFLSVASKAAALALLVRITLGLGLLPGGQVETAAAPTGEAVYMVAEPSTPVAIENDSAVEENASSVVSADDPLASMRNFLALVVALLAAVTCTFGNLTAYAQTNIKRLLAYSTIAHAGYMMLPVAAALMLVGVNNGQAQSAIASLAIYMAIYLFMNLGAFAIVAFLRNTYRTEDIDDYAGLIQTSPGIVICFAVILFSLVGIPPLAGFVGKFLIFASLAEGYQTTGHRFLMYLLLIGGLNTAISLFYYLRVVKVMVIDEPSGESSTRSFSLMSASGAFLLIVTLPLILLFVKWDALNGWSQMAAKHLF